MVTERHLRNKIADKICKSKEKPKVIILDDNPLSIRSYAEEYPENWKKICEALDSEDKNGKTKNI